LAAFRLVSKQRDELQARMTEMVQERQRWRDPVRIKELARKHAAQGDDAVPAYEDAMRELVEAP
jgi:hypothetical protein